MNVLKVGRYRVLRRLGGGGSADVYLAEDTQLRRKVALKVARSGEVHRAKGEGFEREAWCASLLNHPNIVTIYDVGIESDLHFIASEYVEGKTLREILQHGPLPLNDALEVAIGVANALMAAHESWVVHRDVKPENIMIRRDRGIKVLDFGVATLAGGGDETDPLRKPGALVGTLGYLSPEQVRGEPIIDARSDLYSLGVVLFEMLHGTRPFLADNPLDLLATIVEIDPPPLSDCIPLALHRIVGQAMQKSIWDRYQTAEDFRDDLTEVRLDLMLRERGEKIEQ